MSASSPSQKFRFPVYQIDFSAVQAGKHVASTKRRIRWRFGFPNRQALDAGRSGTDCRGEEHEVVIIWSITSGKRQILMDGREIHYSSNRTGVLDHSWSTKGNHVLKTLCHAAPPLSKTPGFRQYDLMIDGQSFFTMPKVYELGVKGFGERMPSNMDYGSAAPSGYPPSSYAPVGASNSGYDNYGSDPSAIAPRTLTEEEEDLRKAISASLQESKRHLGEPAPTTSSTSTEILSSAAPPTADLLDFGGDSSYPAPGPPPPAPAAVGMPPNAPAYGYDSYGAPPPQQSYQAYQPTSAYMGAPALTYGSSAPSNQYLALPSSQPQPPPTSAPMYAQSPQQSTASTAQPNYYSSSVLSPTSQSYGGASSVGGASAYNSGLGGNSSGYVGYANEDPFAPKPPSHNDIASDILKAYAAPSPTGRPTSGPVPPNQYGSPQPMNGYNSVQENGGALSPDSQMKLSMNALSLTDQSSAGESKPKNPFDEVLSKLVNLDHIDEPAEEKFKLTMKQKEEEEKKKKIHKSKPLPPAAKGMVGSSASLAQISEVKPKLPPKELVMKPPPSLFSGDPAMAGALVVHGSPFSNPPPLQARGVGVVHMQGQYPAAAGGMPMYGMGQPQQQQQQMMPPMQTGYQPQQQYPPAGQPQYQQQPQGYGYR